MRFGARLEGIHKEGREKVERERRQNCLEPDIDYVMNTSPEQLNAEYHKLAREDVELAMKIEMFAREARSQLEAQQ